MISYQQAIEKLFEVAKPLSTEKLTLNKCLKRVLAENVYYDMDMPPFDKSAMDGFACRRSDLDKEMEIIGTIQAGATPVNYIEEGQCAKIMTGAAVPRGANCVFMKEDAEYISENTVKCSNLNTRNNICYQGEDIKKGDLILKKGSILNSKHFPLLAGAGVINPCVYKLPKVLVFATGNELVEPDKTPDEFQIRNSNSSQLLAQLSDCGMQADYKGILPDSLDILKQQLTELSPKYDLILFTGGVSVGDYDLMPKALEQLGYKAIFSKTAIQPGKPIIFAKLANTFTFGLSGNPVSSFIQFELYVKAFIYHLMGAQHEPTILRVPLANSFKRRKDSRLQFIPGIINNNKEVKLVEFHGSAHINALIKADCLVEIPIGMKEIPKGDLVNIRLLI